MSSTRTLLVAWTFCLIGAAVACGVVDSPIPTVVPAPVATAPVSPVPATVPADTPASGTRAAATPTPVPEQTLTAPPAPVSPESPTPESLVPMSPLMASLAVTPLAFADSPIVFADYAGSRAATGLEDVQGIDDVLSALSAENPEAMQRIYEGIAIDVDFLSRTIILKDRVGLDVYAFDRSIWSSEPKHEAPGFLLIQGKFDIENVIDNLMELDYTKDSHGGADYYRLGDDFGYSIAHPLRGLGLTLNRVAWLDPWLAAARSTGIVAELIDVQRGRASGLLTSEGHRALAEAVGEGLIGGAFLPPQWVLENWNTVNTGPVERLDRYMKGAGRWDRLSPYSLALFGYRAWEDAEETVVALFYTDPTAAEHDAQELKKRWDGFHYTLIGLMGGTQEVPATASCSPFSTSVFRQPGYSVLVGTCPVVRGQEPDPTVKGPSLWLWLFDTRELQFLVRDLEDLRNEP